MLKNANSNRFRYGNYEKFPVSFTIRSDFAVGVFLFFFSGLGQVSRTVVGNRPHIMATNLTFDFVANPLRVSNFSEVFVFEITRVTSIEYVTIDALL